MTTASPTPPVNVSATPRLPQPHSSEQRLRQASRDFEAQVLGALMQPMFEGLGPSGAFGGGTGEAQWRPMLVAEYGRAIARAGGLGLADSVLATLQRMQQTDGQ